MNTVDMYANIAPFNLCIHASIVACQVGLDSLVHKGFVKIVRYHSPAYIPPLKEVGFTLDSVTLDS